MRYLMEVGKKERRGKKGVEGELGSGEGDSSRRIETPDVCEDARKWVLNPQ
jgi:hypothetical protein